MKKLPRDLTDAFDELISRALQYNVAGTADYLIYQGATICFTCAPSMEEATNLITSCVAFAHKAVEEIVFGDKSMCAKEEGTRE